MRVGIYFHSGDRFLSGVEYYALGLMNALFRIDCRNSYTIFTNCGATVRRKIQMGGNVSVLEQEGLGSRWRRVLWEQTRLAKLALHERVDVLHCPSYVAPRTCGRVKSVITIHDTIALDHPGWCKPTNAAYYRFALARSVRNAKRVIVVSRSTAHDVIRRFKGSESKLSLIYPGIDSIFRSPLKAQDTQQVRARYGLPERFVLYVGNVEPKKNLNAVLDAWELVLRRGGLRQKLVLVGQRSWNARRLKRRIEAAVARGEVVVAGYVEREDLPHIYRMADVLVQASLYEGFGFPPLEAMACGVPVVSSMCGALEETSGSAAYKVDPSDPASIASGIERLIEDSSLRARHIEAGRRQSDRFAWDDAARRVLEVYEGAAGE